MGVGALLPSLIFMNDDTLIKIISACVAPAMFISGTSMLVLAFLGRQGVLTGRLRELHEKALHFAERGHKENNDYCRERAELAIAQGKAVFVRTRTVKWVLVGLFIAIASFLLTSMGLGLGIYIKEALPVAMGFFVMGMVSLCLGVLFALGAAFQSLNPLRDEEVATEAMLKRFKDTVTGINRE